MPTRAPRWWSTYSPVTTRFPVYPPPVSLAAFTAVRQLPPGHDLLQIKVWNSVVHEITAFFVVLNLLVSK